MASRNADPHQKCSSNQPPTSGPIAVPPETLATITPIATARWWASRNIAAVSDSVEGMRVAPVTPISARAAISSSGLGAYAASADARP